jgi:IclR family KDG regulon transcriptional repressor
MDAKRFKRVPALDKCFAIIDLLLRSRKPMGISEISAQLGLNKSTVFNITHTLTDLDVLENYHNAKFTFGTRFYVLANMAGKRSNLVQLAHPYLEMIIEKTNLSAFLGVRSDSRAVIIDKVDSVEGLRVASEIGMQMPGLAGAGIKAMLSQLPDQTVDEILNRTSLKKFTRLSITDIAAYKREVRETREQGIAYDLGEYIEGAVAFAVPINGYGRDNVQAAIWAAGSKNQVNERSLPLLRDLLINVSEEINLRLR